MSQFSLPAGLLRLLAGGACRIKNGACSRCGTSIKSAALVLDTIPDLALTAQICPAYAIVYAGLQERMAGNRVAIDALLKGEELEHKVLQTLLADLATVLTFFRIRLAAINNAHELMAALGPTLRNLPEAEKALRDHAAKLDGMAKDGVKLVEAMTDSVSILRTLLTAVTPRQNGPGKEDSRIPRDLREFLTSMFPGAELHFVDLEDLLGGEPRHAAAPPSRSTQCRRQCRRKKSQKRD